MNIKGTTRIWILILTVSIDVFILNSFYKLILFEKLLVFTCDAVLIFFAFFYNRNKQIKYLIFAFIVLPVAYLAIRFNIHLLREPTFWIILLKSFFASYLFIEQNDSDNQLIIHTKINFYIPLFIIIALNVFFITTDTLAPSWDPARHARNALAVNDIFRQDGLTEAWMYYDFYPSLGYIITIPFQWVFGRNYDALVLSIILFWFPLMYFFTNKIFRDIFNVKEEKISFLNFAFHSNVMLLSYMKQFIIDYQMVVLLTMQFYFLHKSQNPEKVKFLVLIGVLSGLGFMIKQSFLVPSLFMISLYMVFVARKEFTSKEPNQLFKIYLKVALICLCLAAITVPWFAGWSYMFNWEMKNGGGYEESGLREGDPSVYSLDSLLWYFKAFGYYFTWPVLIILIIGYIVAYRKSNEKKNILILLSCLFSLWLFFTVLRNKDFRYLTPAFLFFMPAYAGLAYLKDRISFILISSIVIISLYINFAQIFPSSFNYPTIGKVSPYAKGHAKSNFMNAPLSYAVAVSLSSKNNIQYLESENINNNEDCNDFNRAFYLKMLGADQVKFDKPLLDTVGLVKSELYSWGNNTLYGYTRKEKQSSEFILYRDSIYSCYYFFKFSRHSSGVLIEKIGHYGKITGDIRFLIRRGNEIRQDTLPFREKFVYLVLDTTAIHIRAQIFHAQGRWPIIYRQQFSGEIPIDMNLSLTPVNMIPLRRNVTENSFELKRP